jgi:hypothetical protein
MGVVQRNELAIPLSELREVRAEGRKHEVRTSVLLVRCATDSVIRATPVDVSSRWFRNLKKNRFTRKNCPY